MPVVNARPLFCEDAVPVWIASVPDVIRNRTTTKNQADDLLEADEEIRKRTQQHANDLAMDSQLRNLLAEKLVPEEHFEYDDSAVHCIALVRPELKPCSFDMLDHGQNLQRDWFSRLTAGACNIGHTYFLQVIDCLPLDAPKVLPRLYGSSSFIHDLPDFFHCDMLEDVILKHGSPEWLIETKVCIRTAKGFAAALAHGGLRSLGLCELGRSRGLDIPRPLWSIGWENRRMASKLPAIAALRDGFFENMFDGVDPDFIFQHKVMSAPSQRKLVSTGQAVVNELMKLAKKHQQAMSWQQLDCLNEFHDMITSLQVCCDEADHREDMSTNRICRQYPALYLLRCFMLSQSLKNDKELRLVCEQALAIVCPRGHASQYLQQVLADQSLPSASTISRTRARIDTTWMIVFRQTMARMIAAGGVSIFIAWDASPQGGRDYQMAVLDVAPVSDLAKMQCVIQKLAHWHRVLAS